MTEHSTANDSRILPACLSPSYASCSCVVPFVSLQEGGLVVVLLEGLGPEVPVSQNGCEEEMKRAEHTKHMQ